MLKTVCNLIPIPVCRRTLKCIQCIMTLFFFLRKGKRQKMVHSIIQYLQHTENYHTSTVSTELDRCSSYAFIGPEGMSTSYYYYSRTKYLNSLSCPVPPSNAKQGVKSFPIVITRLKYRWNMQQSQWLIIVITLVRRLNEGWKKSLVWVSGKNS